MKKLNILLAILLFFSLSLTAQKDGKDYNYKNTKAAEKLFKETKYLEAAVLFEKAYSKAKNSKEKGFITYHIAVANQYTARNKEAKKYYERALRLKYDKYEEDIYRRLAQMQMQDGEYKDAKKNFALALKKNPNDDIAKKGLEACGKVKQILERKTKHKVEVVKELNSDDFDWSISQFDKRGEQFMFSSCRKASTGSKTDDLIGEEYTDLYVTSLDRNGNFGEPVSLGKTINSEYHEASAVMFNNGNSIMFTRCVSEKNKNIGCKIYTADKRGKNWKEPVMIELSDSMGYSEGHPATNRRGQFIVFASDMPGGLGGKDLWITLYNKREKSWGAPKNLGSDINTAGDEKFPTIDKDGVLYYSSNGLPGIGGLDLFRAEKTGAANQYQWATPTNLGFPLNSSKDDHGIIFTSSSSGYFSSSRLGKNQQDKKSDIFKFKLPECALTLKGRVRDQDTKEPLAGATVTLTGTDGTTATIKADSEGNFEFGKRGRSRYIKKGVNYTLEFEHQNGDKFWLKKKSKRSTMDKDLCNETFYEDIELLCAVGCKPIIMPEVQYPLGKATLLVNDKVNSKDSLQFLYDVMIDNPTIRVQLESHTDCRDSDEKNQELSQRRAQTCVDYLISKGIDRSRLVAKGFGESQPRVISENGKDKTLGCDMITGLNTSNPTLFEKYHQLNRRTTFSVIVAPKQ
jgi:peptidoglycan-associated lipoprotein